MVLSVCKCKCKRLQKGKAKEKKKLSVIHQSPVTVVYHDATAAPTLEAAINAPSFRLRVLNPHSCNIGIVDLVPSPPDTDDDEVVVIIDGSAGRRGSTSRLHTTLEKKPYAFAGPSAYLRRYNSPKSSVFFPRSNCALR